MADTTKDTSVDGLAGELEALLTGSADADASSEADEETAAEPTDDEGTVEEESTEESEEESEEEAEEEQDEEEADVAPKGVSGKTVVFTLSDGDKETPVTAEEAKAGMMLRADHTRKTQEMAEERKATQAERTALSEALGRVLTALDGADEDATPEKLAELARTDPEKALQMRFEKDARIEQRGKIATAKKTLDEKNQQEVAAEAAKVQQAEFGKLTALYPDLADPVKAKPILTRMTEAAVAAGFSAEDMNRITDHRLMKLLDLAATGMRLGKKPAPTPEKKGGKGPVITPGFRASGGTRKVAAEADQQFKKDRSVDSAVASLQATLTAHRK